MGPKTPDPAPPIYPIDILLQIPARELVMIDCAAYHGINRRGKVLFLGNDGMQTKRLGKSAVVVSKICMGTMTFGNQADEATSFGILDKAFDSGINFFDTVENYPVPPSEEWAGRTEEIVGRWIKTKRRDAVILATKVCGPRHGWLKASQRAGVTALDRHNIVRAIEASLKRLNTDYVDLYQSHWPDHGARYEGSASRAR
jgi:aryl-alcohol dehydrogenase-like predicted oxidoreductase